MHDNQTDDVKFSVRSTSVLRMTGHIIGFFFVSIKSCERTRARAHLLENHIVDVHCFLSNVCGITIRKHCTLCCCYVLTIFSIVIGNEISVDFRLNHRTLKAHDASDFHVPFHFFFLLFKT